mmetsp:Transcript_10735/g.33884  ORF Transcript_10735/g.33884 Transcript_10735/m.33884 type:complete len:206 (-) Transcript_10735:1350-1967(-)
MNHGANRQRQILAHPLQPARHDGRLRVAELCEHVRRALLWRHVVLAVADEEQHALGGGPSARPAVPPVVPCALRPVRHLDTRGRRRVVRRAVGTEQRTLAKLVAHHLEVRRAPEERGACERGRARLLLVAERLPPQQRRRRRRSRGHAHVRAARRRRARQSRRAGCRLDRARACARRQWPCDGRGAEQGRMRADGRCKGGEKEGE